MPFNIFGGVNLLLSSHALHLTLSLYGLASGVRAGRGRGREGKGGRKVSGAGTWRRSHAECLDPHADLDAPVRFLG